MNFFKPLRPAANLTSVLEKEHSALLSGDFKLLEKVSAPKEHWMKVTARTRPTQQELTALKKLTDRNRRLLEASARGLKSAKQRITSLRTRPMHLNTYGPSGQMTQLNDRALTIKKTI